MKIVKKAPGTPSANAVDRLPQWKVLVVDDENVVGTVQEHDIAWHVRTANGFSIGVEHAGTTVRATTAGTDIHVWDRDGLHLCTITTQPGKRYYGNGRRPGRPRPPQVSGMS